MKNPSTKSIVYIVFAFATVFAINYLFLFYKLGLGFFIFNLLMVVFYETARFIANKDKYLNRYQLLIIPIIYLSSMFFFRDDGFVLTLDFLALMMLIPSYVILTCNPSFSKTFSFFEIFSMIKVLGYAENILKKVTSLFSRSDGKKVSSSSTQIIYKILIALAITFPIFIIVLAILVSADQIFSKGINEFFSFVFTDVINLGQIIKLCISAGFAFVIWSYLTGIINKHDKLKADTADWVHKISSDKIIPFILINSLNFIYFLFIIIQFGYLFGGESFTHQYGVTFSEYAVKGFWEMLVVVGINYILLYVLQTRFSLKTIISKAILIPSYLFTIFSSIVMLISSFKRIMVYIDGYGLTRDRLIPLSFLLFIALILVLLVINLFLNDEYRKTFLKLGTFIVGLLFLMGFSAFSMDRTIVRHNIYMPQADYEYLVYELGIEGEVELLKNKVTIESSGFGDLQDALERKYDYFGEYQGVERTRQYSWQELNLPIIEFNILTK